MLRMFEMEGAQYSWIKNVEIENISKVRNVYIYSLQNEIKECYLHTGIDGYGHNRGYGIVLTAQLE